MAYLTYQEYYAYEGFEINAADFGKCLHEAERIVDYVTSGVDNVRKLEVAFPTNERDVEAVKRCIASLVTEIKVSNDIAAQVYAQTQAGGVVNSGIAQSMSSGSESITFAALPASYTSGGDRAEREKYLQRCAVSLLRGACDANGVNLLYGGRYPHVIETE